MSSWRKSTRVPSWRRRVYPCCLATRSTPCQRVSSLKNTGFIRRRSLEYCSNGLQREHRDFRRAVDSHGNINSSNPPAHEHRCSIATADAGDDGKLLRGDGADERKHDLTAV